MVTRFIIIYTDSPPKSLTPTPRLRTPSSPAPLLLSPLFLPSSSIPQPSRFPGCSLTYLLNLRATLWTAWVRLRKRFLYKLTLSRLLNIELWLFPLAIRTHLRRLLFVPDIMSGVHLCSLLWPLQTCCLWARLQVTSKSRNCQKVVRKIKLAYLNLETPLVCTQLTKCFSDYHYNEAYREGGGYICPAQVFKSTYIANNLYNISRFPKSYQVAYGRVLRALSLSGAWKVVITKLQKNVEMPLFS